MTIPLVGNTSLRLFYFFERASINDWHYAGFDTHRAIDHRVYTEGGPQSCNANLVGVLVNVTF